MSYKDLSDIDLNRLRAKVTNEYGQADMHTSQWKEDVRHNARDYLLAKPKQDRIKVRKVLNNLTIRLATFLSDEIQVTNVSMNGALGSENASNCDKVFEANFKTMSIRDKYREAIIDDALTGVGVLTVDGWNDHTLEPIVSYIDSRLTYPDPKNWQDNKLRFFGTKVRKSIYELETDDAYDKDCLNEIKFYADEDIERVNQNDDDQKNFNYSDKGEDQVDIYNHLTVFKAEADEVPYLYLTSWGLGTSKLVRCIKMRALTEGEIADPSTIDFGVKFFRAKPLKGSYAGVSIVDDVGQYQDIETLLTNLQIEQAKEAGMGGRTFLDTRLGVNANDVANLTGPGSVIPFTSTDPNLNASNGIYQEPSKPQNPIVSNTIFAVNQLSQLADPSGNQLAQGQSLSGSQTKAEVQTIQQNINQVLSYMASNYMESLKGLWESIYRSYSANMSPQRKKEIVIVDSNNVANAYGFKKNEFISKGDFYIVITSKAQEDIKKKQDFAILLSVVGTLKQSVKPGSNQDVRIDRLLIEKSGIRGLTAEAIHPLTRDERQAYQNLVLLNNDVELKTKPAVGEDHNIYIDIYKTGLQTKARDKAIFLREQILASEPRGTDVTPEVAGTSTGGQARSLGASMLAQQAGQQVPSLSNIG